MDMKAQNGNPAGRERLGSRLGFSALHFLPFR